MKSRGLCIFQTGPLRITRGGLCAIVVVVVVSSGVDAIRGSAIFAKETALIMSILKPERLPCTREDRYSGRTKRHDPRPLESVPWGDPGFRMAGAEAEVSMAADGSGGRRESHRQDL